MNNWDRLLEAIKGGKIEGFGPVDDSTCNQRLNGYVVAVKDNGVWAMWSEPMTDHLCAHLRRWLIGKGCLPCLGYKGLVLYPGLLKGKTFKEGSELDWHIDATLYVLDKEKQ